MALAAGRCGADGAPIAWGTGAGEFGEAERGACAAVLAGPFIGVGATGSSGASGAGACTFAGTGAEAGLDASGLAAAGTLVAEPAAAAPAPESITATTV